MSKEEDIQQKVSQFQMMQNQLRGLDEKEKMLITGIEDLERTKVALEDLKDSKGEAYIPLGANNFVLGKVEDNENVLIAVGSGIAVKKKREEAQKIVEERIVEFRGEANKVVNDIKKISGDMMQIQSEVEQLRK